MLRAGPFDALNACSGQAFHPLPFASLREILFRVHSRFPIRVHSRSLFVSIRGPFLQQAQFNLSRWYRRKKRRNPRKPSRGKDQSRERVMTAG